MPNPLRALKIKQIMTTTFTYMYLTLHKLLFNFICLQLVKFKFYTYSDMNVYKILIPKVN